MDMQTTNSNDTTKLSAIERALAAAKARKAAKDAAGITTDAGVEETTPKAAKAKKSEQPAAAKARKAAANAELSEIQRDEARSKRDAQRTERAAAKAAKLAALEAEKSARKAARDAAKAAKAAEREASKVAKVPAHMKKVEKAASKLPKLVTEAQLHVNDIVSNFSADQIAAIALHLQHHNRVAATARAATVKLENGDAVRIVGGDPKYIGMTGTIDRAQRIRCYVAVPGIRKPVYLFTSDVQRVEAAAEAVAV